ncbi:L-type lectin-domain containing protein [Actinoplanes flavus]|uniref:Lectin n=1 Tax=Actinoplanes flavus TaxID=2820290 RepID=A0ABS3UW43_9ACTN|nr:L-type lectin-domain containing protein [Actinoplanes flavus]MBO3742761.1 lectin [Actinoplanes flavus]
MRFSRSSRVARGGLWASTLLSLVAAVSSGAAFAADVEPRTDRDVSLSGTARLVHRPGDSKPVIRLTADGFKQIGSAWLTKRVNLARSFEITFTARLRGGGRTGADGIAFVAQGIGPRALGGWGGGLGYRGLSRSVAVEFDTYQNAPDPDSNHVAVTLGGDPDRHVAAGDPSIPLLGKPFRARIRYDADTQRITAHVRSLAPGATEQLLLDEHVDIAGTTGATRGWIGFTGATGDVTSRQDVYDWAVTTPQA